ncbi:membrane protein [Microbacterium phage Fregley]|nr:membrane protein [Microbacterium phage Fregley]WNT44263.1 membrane protein [Microbacterium phage CandC]
MKKKIAVAAVAALLTIGLAGCGQQVLPSGTAITPLEVDIPGGGSVLCVASSGGGVDCDWDGER